MNTHPPPLTRPPLIADDREESAIISSLMRCGIEVVVMRLEYPSASESGAGAISMGDYAWEGQGPYGPVNVGVERKRLSDLVKCIEDRRLAGAQLIGMRKTYQYIYLIAEGTWRPSATGAVEVLGREGWVPFYSRGRERSCLYDQIDGYLDSMGLRGGVEVIRTRDDWESACVIANRYKRWGRAWGDHHSHDSIYCPDPDTQFEGRAGMHTREPGPVERFAATLPDVDRRAWRVGEHFKNIRDAANANENEWMRALGIRKGRTVANRIVKWITGEIR